MPNNNDPYASLIAGIEKAGNLAPRTNNNIKKMAAANAAAKAAAKAAENAAAANKLAAAANVSFIRTLPAALKTNIESRRINGGRRTKKHLKKHKKTRRSHRHRSA